ncbi:MAG: hypothetical protein EAZ08_06265, partial [Cytophagales bacterium]
MKLITNIWEELADTYAMPKDESEKVWKKLIQAYTHKSRYYHNLTHIEDLLGQAQTHQNHLQDRDSILLAILFHDVVYKASKSDNEKESAVFAQKVMQAMTITAHKISKVYAYIMATKKHEPATDDSDLQFLLDIDLSILASTPTQYKLYTEQIRKEYSIYPDFLYRNGRRKAMESFLERPQIFYFYNEEYENKARENIKNE